MSLFKALNAEWIAPLAAFILVLLLTVSQEPTANAFDCLIPSVEESVEGADAVVLGTIKSVRTIPPEQPPPWDSFQAEVEVERYLKGSGAEVVKASPASEWMHGFWQLDERRVGERYVLFLNGAGESRDIDRLCTRSFSLEHPDGPTALAEVEAITGPGVLPEQGEHQQIGDASNDQSAGLMLAWGAGIATLLAGLAGLVFAYARRP